MANRERGEVEVIVNEKPYTLRLSNNVLCALESRTKRKWGQLLNDMSAVDVIALRETFFAALQAYHAKEFRTAEQVGNWMDDVGRFPKLSSILKDLISVNEPPQAEGSGNPPSEPADPTTDGTGDGSSDAPAASA